MSDRPSNLAISFEKLKKTAPNGEEYWTGRDLQPRLGYSEWRNVDGVIRKGVVACGESSIDPRYHFVEVNKVIEAGKGAKGERGDWYLTRYACYLTAMNGDPSKPRLRPRKHISPCRPAARSLRTRPLPTLKPSG